MADSKPVTRTLETEAPCEAAPSPWKKCASKRAANLGSFRHRIRDHLPGLFPMVAQAPEAFAYAATQAHCFKQFIDVEHVHALIAVFHQRISIDAEELRQLGDRELSHSLNTTRIVLVLQHFSIDNDRRFLTLLVVKIASEKLAAIYPCSGARLRQLRANSAPVDDPHSLHRWLEENCPRLTSLRLLLADEATRNELARRIRSLTHPH